MPMKNENGKVYKFFLPWYKHRRVFVSIFQESRILTAIKRIKSSRMENLDEKQEITLLDLPDLDLECILEKLSPAGLCSMAGVCKTLREKCKSDHLWKKHMNQKWGRLIGDAVYTEWQCKIDSRVIGDSAMQKSPFQWFSRFLDNLFPNRSKMEEGDSKSRSSKHENSIMSCYMALETGKIWFPAQVYNREVIYSICLILIEYCVPNMCLIVFDLLRCRMGILDLCFHVMMLKFTMIPKRTTLWQGLILQFSLCSKH